MQVGDVISWERTFTEKDIRLFGKVSGDEGVHHVLPNERGRLMVQGLLTATLPTKVGGDLDFIASELNFQFRRPVFAGDMIRCEVKVVALEQGEQFLRMSVEWVCHNQHGKEVMTGQGRGVIRNQT